MQAVTKKIGLFAGIGVLSSLTVLLYFSLNLENGLFFPKCPVHHTMGIYCSGCGSQRAIHDLLHLRIGESISHNLLLIPAILVIAQHTLVKFQVLKGKSFLSRRYSPLIVLGIVLLFMLLRNLPFYPFNVLAP